MRHILIALCMLFGFATPAAAQLSINFGSPGVSIGINLGGYPTLQRIPGYPVYYAPGVNSNYFFYDGLYWVYQADNWYASSWYNGPWRIVDPMDVPLYVLRVPVRYYRHAPAYFHGWRADEAPRWGDHWGQSWQQRRSGWDQWNRKSAPAPAPLPTYQRQYSGSRYPQASQQAVIETHNYRYQPKDPVAQQHFQYQRTQAQTAPQQQAAPPQPQRTQQAPRQQQQAQPAQQQPAQQPQQAARTRQQQQAQPQQQIARPQEAQKQQHQQQQQSQQKPQKQQQQQQQQKPQKQQQQQIEHKPQQAPQPKPQDKAPQGKEKKDKKDNNQDQRG
jgi:hypothetical protein